MKSAKKKPPAKKANPAAAGEEYLARVRRICLALPETTEKTSHGAPTFFVHKRVYCMFANNHHQQPP
ncbi:MAG TPA: MmcQ/YjbR family DNA-binding protein [Verrucomicrobiae bacterium]|nr:MmcQ/YjbR family DNA-binding protein [Verrucomicrobiae bacterium]